MLIRAEERRTRLGDRIYRTQQPEIRQRPCRMKFASTAWRWMFIVAVAILVTSSILGNVSVSKMRDEVTVPRFVVGNQVLAFSGGNDSTAMALRMAELGEDFTCLFTPARNEPPELFQHIEDVIARIQKPLVEPPNHSLMFWIQHHGALPNWRQRWCTRQIKIEPCKAYLLEHPGSTLCVGLRADEEDREGLYGEFATYRYPLREWGWKLADVLRYLDAQGVTVPKRTNCMLCYDQQLNEWWELWKTRPEEYAKGELLEAQQGHTFRSPGRDTWPAELSALRQRFEAGHIPRGADVQSRLFDARERCRVCRF